MQSQGRNNGDYLCLHGHFYQPPREDPFTGQIPIESAATPYTNFNEKITAECYRPNAEAGNFDTINFDLGPTLASWLEKAHPNVYQRIIDADRKHMALYGVGNAMAQAYNHTILPLARSRDKLTQILWGLSDFRHRYGRDATGMWLAETAVDIESLDLLAQNGITYTVLAPWQAATPIDPTEPYLVLLPGGRSITVFFFNAPLSGGVSFDWNMTDNADLFAGSYLPDNLVQSKRDAGEAELLLIATDGELYGHHRPWLAWCRKHPVMVLKSVRWSAICVCIRRPKKCNYACLARGAADTVLRAGIQAANALRAIVPGKARLILRCGI
jgi:alpha-amylase/alpha-mannosidase (GH57 family)